MNPSNLTIEIAPSGLKAFRLARQILRDPRFALSVRLLRSPLDPPAGRVLRIEAGSQICSLLTLLWGQDPPDSMPTGDDVDLALNPAVFSDVHRWQLWQATHAPLPRRTRLGTPEQTRPWVLVAPDHPKDVAFVERITGLTGAQVHSLDLKLQRSSADAVTWLPTSSTIASLLGHVDAVIAAPGPLAWDATRTGTPVYSPADFTPPHVLRRLANVIPSTLALDPSFWHALFEQLGRGESLNGTRAWLLQTRERVNARSAIETETLSPLHWGRKLTKLRRDPAAFWSDSWLSRGWESTRRLVMKSRNSR